MANIVVRAMIILAIDPGVAGRGCACAAFTDAFLTAVWFEQFDRALRPLRFNRVIVERPEYQGDRTRAARPADLMALAWAGGMLAGRYAGRDGTVIAWTPREWKGSEPKPVQHARLWAVLNDAECVILGGDRTERTILAAREKGALSRWSRPGASYYPRAFDTHNLLDAAALGATYLGRIERST